MVAEGVWYAATALNAAAVAPGQRVMNFGASGAIRAVIDREYTLHDIRDAYRYVESERKVGIVVIDVG